MEAVMKRYLFWAVLACVAISWTVCAQDRPLAGRGEPQAKPNDRQKIELAHQELELKAQADEVAFQQKMREIQLEKQRIELEKQRAVIHPMPGQQPHPGMQPPCGTWGGHGCPMARHCARGIAFLMTLCFVLHLLLAIWVYQDIRKRNTGSGIWIIITLVAGIFGAALYALVRIGDKPAA
jgi:hypothetical protein